MTIRSCLLRQGRHCHQCHYLTPPEWPFCRADESQCLPVLAGAHQAGRSCGRPGSPRPSPSMLPSLQLEAGECEQPAPISSPVTPSHRRRIRSTASWAAPRAARRLIGPASWDSWRVDHPESPHQGDEARAGVRCNGARRAEVYGPDGESLAEPNDGPALLAGISNAERDELAVRAARPGTRGTPAAGRASRRADQTGPNARMTVPQGTGCRHSGWMPMQPCTMQPLRRDGHGASHDWHPIHNQPAGPPSAQAGPDPAAEAVLPRVSDPRYWLHGQGLRVQPG